MSAPGDDLEDNEDIIIPDFHDHKLELLYDGDISQEDDDLSQNDFISKDDKSNVDYLSQDDDADDDESQDFYAILDPVKPDDQEIYLQVLENLKSAVNADDSGVTEDSAIPNTVRSDTDKDLPYSVLPDFISENHIIYACRLCSYVTQLELKIKHHLKACHDKEKRPRKKQFNPEIAIDENGDSVIKVSNTAKWNILKKLLRTKILKKNSKIYIQRPPFCGPCKADMSKREALYRPPESGYATNAANSATSSTSDSVNVPLVMVGKQNNTDKPEGIMFVSSERQMQLKPIAPASPGVSIFKCNSCDYYSNNKHYLKQHIDIVHNSFRPYKCPFCDYAGKRSHALREHLIVHSNERPFECNFCNATFRKKGHLTNHIKLHNNTKTIVKCPVCKDLVSESNPAAGLTAHLQSAHGTDKLYGCDLCEFIASSEPEIVEHLRDKHLKVNVYKCDKCAFDTNDKTEFEDHVRTHNRNVSSSTSVKSTSPSNRSTTEASIKPVWIKCTECGFTGQDSEIIRQHMLKHLKPVTSNTQSDTIQTLPLKPQGSLPYTDTQTPRNIVPQNIIFKCKECGFTSGSEIEFKKHAETHVLSVRNTQSLKATETNASLGKPNIPTLISSVKGVNILPVKPVTGNEKILVPVTLEPVPVSSVQLQPRKEPAQFIQIAGGKSKEGIRYLPANSDIPVAHMVSSSEKHPTDKTLMSKSRFTPSNFASAVILGGNVVKAVPQKIDSNAEIGQPALARNVIPVLHQRDNVQVHKAQEHVNQVANEIVVSSSGSPEKVESMVLPTNVSGKQVNSQTNQPNMILKDIPVPRNTTLSEAPKLPPEIVQLKLNQVKAAHDNEKDSTNQVEQSNENRLYTLRQSLANVQELIQQQEKLQRQQGTKQGHILDSRGIPEATDTKKVVYYITPVSKQDTLMTSNPGISHDSTAGRFRCTICGYTCEYQRTIKAHIWKHSGNKNVEYPMFQNGPLSIYEGEMYPRVEEFSEETVKSPIKFVNEDVHVPISKAVPEPLKVMHISAEYKDKTVVKSVDSSSEQPETLPPFIVYEESKISNVAPALANLIAARTMVGLGERKKTSESMETDSELSDIKEDNQTKTESLASSTTKRSIENQSDANMPPAKKIRSQLNDSVKKPLSVVVENIQSVASNSDFTGMQSQQGSPQEIGAKSPEHSDSGVSEMTGNSKTGDDRTEVSELFSPIPESRLVIDDREPTDTDRPMKYNLRRTRSQDDRNTHTKNNDQRSTTADRTAHQIEESAVTLLSLLKKGPNFNPACPPKTYNIQTLQTTDRNSQVSSPSLEESNSTGDSDVSVKPKSGISSSLLAVIEQLRERSKSDIEDEKPAVPVQSKKAARRRSRRGSLEDNDNAGDIDNVEQFLYEGEIKYRCKLCHYNNESTLLLRQHMRLHKTKQPFECSLCDFIADSSESLQDHMIQHCKVRLYQCKMCPSTFNYKSQLRAHMRAHNDLDILMCDFCDFETRNVSSLRVHMKTHDPPFSCETCNAAFSTNHNLQVHIKEGKCSLDDENSEMNVQKCGQCEFVAANDKELKYHKRGHKLVEQTLKKCPYCDYTAASIEQVQHHVSNIHGQNKPMKCELCGFQALSVRSLKSHMKRHVNDQRFVQQPLEQYKCNLCGYVCHHLPSLKSHMWRHAADENYSYEFTNEIINSAIDFDGHTDAQDTTDRDVSAFRKLIYDKLKAKGIQTTKETTEKKAHTYCWVVFRCCQCGFETINKAELNVHMKSHSDVIKWTLEISHGPEEEDTEQSEAADILAGVTRKLP